MARRKNKRGRDEKEKPEEEPSLPEGEKDEEEETGAKKTREEDGQAAESVDSVEEPAAGASRLEQLPELVLARIFRMLGFAHRWRLGAVSRLLHERDAAVGGRIFECATIEARTNGYEFYARPRYFAVRGLQLLYSRTKPVWFNYCAALFNKAYIERLKITITNPTQIMCDDLTVLFKAARVESLTLIVSEFSKDTILKVMQTILAQSKTQHLKLEFLRMSKNSLPLIRDEMRRLPSMKSIEIDWDHPKLRDKDQGEQYGYPIDAEIVKHLIAAAPKVELGHSSKLTADDIMEFAKICREYEGERELNLITQKNVFDGVRAAVADDADYAWIRPGRRLEHLPTGSFIVLWHLTETREMQDRETTWKKYRKIEELAYQNFHLNNPYIDYYRCTLTKDPKKPKWNCC